MIPAARATVAVAASATVLALSPGALGAWQGSGDQDGDLLSAALGYTLTGTNVISGGSEYSWTEPLTVLGATDHLSVTNTGSVPETIAATVSVTGLIGGSAVLYGCPNTFTGITCTGRVTLATIANDTAPTVTLATDQAAAGQYNLAVDLPGLLGLSVTTTMTSFVITHRAGIDRTTG